MMRMNRWTFSRKVSVSIAAATLIVAIVTSGFVYVTFKYWTESQEVALLDSKLKQFELQMNDVAFLPSLLQPSTGKGSDKSSLFKPDLSTFLSELDAGQRLEMVDLDGQVLAEVGSEISGNEIEYKAERELKLPAYGSVKLILIEESGHSRSAAVERVVGRLLLLGLIIAAGMAIIVGGIVARSTLKPIRRMISEVRSIRANNLSMRLHLPIAKDELYQLGESFNVFLHKLDVSFDQQRRFVADASHELKTPIAIIEGHTHMIQRWGRKSPEVLDESLALMMNETKRMKELIAQLLLLAESEEPVPLDAVEVCDLKMTLSELLPQTVHVNPEVQLDYDDNPSGVATLVRMPANASYQVLRNIIENALKYTPKGGTVRIRLHETEGKLAVSVADTGIGISSEQLPHIFDRFYRTESSRNRTQGGSGLGLAITKAIMERYGGTITIDSTLGQGTRVTLHYIKG